MCPKKKISSRKILSRCHWTPADHVTCRISCGMTHFAVFEHKKSPFRTGHIPRFTQIHATISKNVVQAHGLCCPISTIIPWTTASELKCVHMGRLQTSSTTARKKLVKVALAFRSSTNQSCTFPRLTSRQASDLQEGDTALLPVSLTEKYLQSLNVRQPLLLQMNLSRCLNRRSHGFMRNMWHY